jgi:hypothetical protein
VAAVAATVNEIADGEGPMAQYAVGSPAREGDPHHHKARGRPVGRCGGCFIRARSDAAPESGERLFADAGQAGLPLHDGERLSVVVMVDVPQSDTAD